jgi:hypothetical protein
MKIVRQIKHPVNNIPIFILDKGGFLIGTPIGKAKSFFTNKLLISKTGRSR